MVRQTEQEAQKKVRKNVSVSNAFIDAVGSLTGNFSKFIEKAGWKEINRRNRKPKEPK